MFKTLCHSLRTTEVIIRAHILIVSKKNEVSDLIYKRYANRKRDNSYFMANH